MQSNLMPLTSMPKDLSKKPPLKRQLKLYNFNAEFPPSPSKSIYEPRDLFLLLGAHLIDFSASFV
jgi:hypothetical protein